VALGAGQALTGPAWQALIPHVVSDEQIPAAVSLMQAGAMLAMAAGPALGGFLVASRGTTGALALQSATFAVLALASVAVHTRRVPQPRAGGGRPSAWRGYRVLRRDRLLGPLIVAVLAAVLSLQVITVVEVFFVRDTLGAGPTGFGAVGAVTALAMVVGAAVAGRIGRAGRQARAVLTSLVAVAAAVLAAGLASRLVLFAAAMVVLGLGSGVLNGCFSALLLQRVPEDVRGRATAAVMGALQACTLAGMLAGGILGGLASPRVVYAGAGIAGLVVASGAWIALRKVVGAAPAGACGEGGA